MDTNKFNSEVLTLQKFFQTYCHGNSHENILNRDVTLEYKDKTFNYKLELCEECFTTISYSFEKLQECPHEIKPMCRTCPNPCYEKPKWKELAKIMRYSGVKLGLTKIKSKLKNIFS